MLIAHFWGCAARGPTRVDRDHLADLSLLMTGTFASTQQHQRDPEHFLDIQLAMTPIWPEHTSDVQGWLYVEQALASALDKPYRQRVYRVAVLVPTARVADASFVSEVYELPTPKAFVNANGDPARFEALTPEALIRRNGCDVFLSRNPDGSYTGATNGTDCLSVLRGASYATSKVTISSDGILAWDQGFDASGTQVWGPERGPYEFRRVD